MRNRLQQVIDPVEVSIFWVEGSAQPFAPQRMFRMLRVFDGFQ